MEAVGIPGPIVTVIFTLLVTRFHLYAQMHLIPLLLSFPALISVGVCTWVLRVCVHDFFDIVNLTYL